MNHAQLVNLKYLFDDFSDMVCKKYSPNCDDCPFGFLSIGGESHCISGKIWWGINEEIDKHEND